MSHSLTLTLINVLLIRFLKYGVFRLNLVLPHLLIKYQPLVLHLLTLFPLYIFRNRTTYDLGDRMTYKNTHNLPTDAL